MAWKIYESAAPLDAEHLDAFEDAHNLKLPVLYRQFLTAHNGGFVMPNRFVMLGPVSEPQQQQTERGGKIDWFLTIGHSELGALGDFLQQYRVSAARIPAELIPIGHDGEGNLICMGLQAADIYFWDAALEYPPGMAPGLQNIYFVADDLIVFLDNLFSG